MNNERHFPNSQISPFDPQAHAYALLRLAIGTSMLTHGIKRIGHIPAFADKTVTLFAPTFLPKAAVVAFAWTTPPLELLIGLLVAAGLFTRVGLSLGGLWMVLLIFGSNLIEQYDWVGIQLLYALIFAVLLYGVKVNVLSADRLFVERRPDTAV